MLLQATNGVPRTAHVIVLGKKSRTGPVMEKRGLAETGVRHGPQCMVQQSPLRKQEQGSATTVHAAIRGKIVLIVNPLRSALAGQPISMSLHDRDNFIGVEKPMWIHRPFKTHLRGRKREEVPAKQI